MPRLSEHHKVQLLECLGYYMPMDLRLKVARELPEAYQAWCDQDSELEGFKPTGVLTPLNEGQDNG